MSDSTVPVPVLEGRGLVKTFGTVKALQGADFIVEAGTVTACSATTALASRRS